MTRSVEVLTGLEAMAAIVPAWENMAAAALEPNPFYEPWMVLPLQRTGSFKGLPLPTSAFSTSRAMDRSTGHCWRPARNAR